MASSSFELRRELDCPICLSIYRDPVTLSCGHNFCRGCINCALDAQEQSGVYTCPGCRKEFSQRPLLQKNITLCNIAETFSKTPEKEIIFCTYCMDSPVPAMKSCLMCEASLCDKHLGVHRKSAEHVLSEPTTNFAKVKCSTHGQIFMYRCSEDMAYVCASCTVSGKHAGHQMELLSESCERKKKDLMDTYEELRLEKTASEKMIQGLNQPKEKLESKFAAINEKVFSIFADIQKQLKELRESVLLEIKTQKKQMVSAITVQIDDLDAKKQELVRRMDHIQELCNMTDPISILEEQDLDIGRTDSKDHTDVSKKDQIIQEDVDESGFIMMIKEGFVEIFTRQRNKLQADGQATITLDINTAANNVSISDDYKTASWLVNQGRPKVPGRFQYHQVLSTEKFPSGRHYWEVKSSESGNWMVGMTYPSIDRDGSQAIIGKNTKSWSLCRWNSQYFALHDRKQTQLNIKFACRKFRVCLDYGAGKLSFYELNNLTKPVHTFTTTFTEPLHAAISVWDSAWVTILGQEPL